MKGLNSKSKKPVTEILLLPGEVVIRNYHAAQLLSPKCDCYLTITNLRAIVSGLYESLLGDNSAIFQQVNIAGISGVNSGFSVVTDWLRVLIFVALEIAVVTIADSWLSGFEFFKNHPIGALFFLGILVAGTVAFCTRRQFVLELFAPAASTPIRLGEGYGAKSGLLALAGEPGANAGSIIEEVGAMIEDLKTNGEEAVKRWLEKAAEEVLREKEKARVLLRNQLGDDLEDALSTNELRWHNMDATNDRPDSKIGAGRLREALKRSELWG
jgi:hypothetical protein